MPESSCDFSICISLCFLCCPLQLTQSTLKMSLTMSPFGPRSTYNWGQTAETIDITFPVAKGVTARDLVIKVTPTTILAGLKGSESTVVQVRSFSLLSQENPGKTASSHIKHNMSDIIHRSFLIFMVTTSRFRRPRNVSFGIFPSLPLKSPISSSCHINIGIYLT